MSNSGVVQLKPVKGSELIKQHAESPTETGSRYVPPSKRGEEAKVIKPLTAEQLDSKTNFPSLPSMGMTKAASWSQLRAKLSSPPATPRLDTLIVEEPAVENSMKVVIEESLKRGIAAVEEALSREAITDPFLMSRDRAHREGWEILKLNMTAEEKLRWLEKSIYNYNETVEEPYAWPAPIMSFSVDKVQKLIQPS